VELLLLIIGIFNAIIASGLLLTFLWRKSFDTPCDDGGMRALVIVPLRGLDYGLRENLISIKSQDYGNYKILGVIDSTDDPAYSIAKELGISCITSEFNCERCSGKVRAISSALASASDYDVIAVADSDIRVGSKWLQCLVSPLSDRKVGVTTTFPSFYPEGGFWSRVKTFWGMVGQSMMESNLTRFVWGGSMAFRSDIVDKNFLREFSESISDDVSVMNIVKSRGMEIFYVKGSAPEVHSEDDFSSFIEWSGRQTALSINASRKIFIFGVIYFGLSAYLIVCSLTLGVIYPLFLVFLFPYAFNSVKSEIRSPVRTWYFPVITLILPFVYLYNLIAGIRMKEIVWRGRTYRLR
jgi:cellulose synthase/poly-beta-1,6-N-acetylglucosamine synthase-like glycosyltransferase